MVDYWQNAILLWAVIEQPTNSARNGIIYNPGQKSLGQYCNIHMFLSFLCSPLKQCILFKIFLQFSLHLPYTKLKLGKKIWIHASNIVCGVRGGVGPVWIGKRPRNAKVSHVFCRNWKTSDSDESVGCDKCCDCDECFDCDEWRDCGECCYCVKFCNCDECDHLSLNTTPHHHPTDVDLIRSALSWSAFIQLAALNANTAYRRLV